MKRGKRLFFCGVWVDMWDVGCGGLMSVWWWEG